MLIIVPAVVLTQAIANTSAHSSSSDRSPTVVQPPDTTKASDSLEQLNILNQPIQPLQPPTPAQEKPREDELNLPYPAYCEFYVANTELGSWQYHQDLQRCISGQ